MITLYKAQSHGDRHAPNLHLSATKPLPDDDIPLSTSEADYLAARYAVFDEQAEIIFSALVTSLPGGTIDALLMRLLQHRRCVMVIPQPKTEARPK